MLRQHQLSFDKHLGRGSSFEVSREILSGQPDEDWEPYYVAVKRIIVSGNDRESLKRRYDSIMREIRVLTHPGLSHNNSIIPILAYGWTTSPIGMQPYLVMTYSELGTLDEYLQSVRESVDFRYGLALDVAYGLKDLHESRIIHGDLKPRNILVFPVSYRSRGQIAKIADFGASIFELDEAQTTNYAGTSLYKTPRRDEQVSMPRALLYKDDIYAFGITLWETMNGGMSYRKNWPRYKAKRNENWDIIGVEEEADEVLRHALDFCIQWDEFDAIWKAVRKCFVLTLKGSGELRSTISEVVDVLSLGIP